MIVHIEFDWDDGYGYCDDCGDLPANYLAPDLAFTHQRPGRVPLVAIGQKLCPICAALWASYGERLERLWKDEEE